MQLSNIKNTIKTKKKTLKINYIQPQEYFKEWNIYLVNIYV